MSWKAPKAREPIEAWDIEALFGVPVLTGFDGSGRLVCQHLHWWSNARFGTERGVFIEGLPKRGGVGAAHASPAASTHIDEK